MITNKLKKILYFPLAYYFKFFAKIQLAIWKPRIIVVTGSSGKTTLLHLIESQLQNKARYSHFANSSYGIPFDILGLRRKDLTVGEWPYLFLAAPFRAFRKPPKEKLYVVEADCDRPYEGKFLASLLKPEVTLWTNVSRTHTANFDSVVIARSPAQRDDEAISVGGLPHQSADWFAMTQVEEAIAHEFGYFLEATKDLAIVNDDSELIKKQIRRSKAKIKKVSQKNTEYHKVFKNHIEFKINGKAYSINALLPKEASLSIQMTLLLLNYLKIKPDNSFSKFKLPPGRTSVFKGIKNNTIIDSSYNATPDGVKAILNMFGLYPSDKKWLVLGDMIELGNEEQEEHEKIADVINAMKLDKIILVGPRLLKYTYPKLKILFNRHPELVSGSLNENPKFEYRNSKQCQMTKIQNSKRFEHSDFDQAKPENLFRISNFGIRILPYEMPKDALDYLTDNLKGGEVVLFKGARFLEGIIQHLLIDKNDVKKLPRRERVWQIRRKQWGL